MVDLLEAPAAEAPATAGPEARLPGLLLAAVAVIATCGLIY